MSKMEKTKFSENLQTFYQRTGLKITKRPEKTPEKKGENPGNFFDKNSKKFSLEGTLLPRPPYDPFPIK